MLERTAIAALLALAIALVGGLPAATAEPATCAVCCEGNSVCEALAGLTDLHTTVDELVPDAGIAHSLDAKLDAAIASELGSRVTPALDQIDAFGNEVDGLESGGQLATETSSVLKAKQDQVKALINNTR